ncbi:hypothetical protein HZH66_004060 [Vespula vulgaris]|uniref:Uncharacterized protein n=1 Tax=Vespula vulgaris TaxID=7454 RepID=A0A834NEH4_VESVU|nr:hypothetical protein HZH66_004060 [Vespula vulgaris]
MNQQNVDIVITSSCYLGRRIRFPQDETVFPEELLNSNILGFNLPHRIDLSRNDRNENDLDSYNEGTHRMWSDKRELGHSNVTRTEYNA